MPRQRDRLTTRHNGRTVIREREYRNSISPAGDSAFTIQGDSDALAAYIANQPKKATVVPAKAKFVGLASNKIPATMTSLEIDA